MSEKIEWDYIEFETENDQHCLDGITKESEIDFHIWEDGGDYFWQRR